MPKKLKQTEQKWTRAGAKRSRGDRDDQVTKS